MKHRLGKFGTVFLAVALCLAITGAGFAHWHEDLTIVGDVHTGDANAGMDLVESWDLETAAHPEYAKDPDPHGQQGPDHSGGTTARLDKDVGCTTVTGTDSDNDGKWETMTITITDAYPCYISGVTYDVVNTGSVPIEIVGIRAVGEVPAELHVTSIDLAREGVFDMCDIKTGTVIEITEDIRAQIDPGEAHKAGIGVSVSDPYYGCPECDENASYTFTVEIQTQQWNY